MLEMYRIGDLIEADRRPEVIVNDDPYSNDPFRMPDFT